MSFLAHPVVSQHIFYRIFALINITLATCPEKFGEALCFQRGFQQGFADFSCFAGVAKRRDHSVESLILLRNCNGFALNSDYHR